MNQLTIFFDMSGYGQFIWPAFAISAAVLAGVFIQSHRFLRRTEKELETFKSHKLDSDRVENISSETKE